MRTKLHFVISRRSPAGNCEKTRSILLVIRSTRKLDNLILDPPLLLLWRKLKITAAQGLGTFLGPTPRENSKEMRGAHSTALELNHVP